MSIKTSASKLPKVYSPFNFDFRVEVAGQAWQTNDYGECMRIKQQAVELGLSGSVQNATRVIDLI